MSGMEGETERQLAESEARLAAAIGSSMDAILTLDVDGRVLSFNPAAERMFGYGEAQAIGAPLAQFIPGAFGSGPSVERPMGTPAHGPIEVTGLRADRKEFQLEAVFSDATAAGRHFYTVFLRDITERVHLEAQLRQAQKMDAIGRLAGGIAHDFNNLLTVIQGYGGIVREGLTDELLRESMDELLKATERAAILTRQLLAFSRKQTLRPVLLDLNSVVLETKLMLRRLIGENIEFVTELASDLCRIKADPGQMGQVILNLAVNARDAMPDTGRLSIRTRNVDLDADAVALLREATPGHWVSLSVHDNGVGMDAATSARAFEPFFTTKEPGKGTGLGLSTVYGIVKQSGGFITVSSALAKGTSFTIYLPRAADEHPPAGGRD
jgi:PAS domain S-box-containing protein